MFTGRRSRALTEAIGHDWPANARKKRCGCLIIEAHHRETVERQIVEKVDEALLQSLEVAVVRGEMIVVDIRDDGDERLQMREGRIRSRPLRRPE